jgi:hypothetical protein
VFVLKKKTKIGYDSVASPEFFLEPWARPRLLSSFDGDITVHMDCPIEADGNTIFTFLVTALKSTRDEPHSRRAAALSSWWSTGQQRYYAGNSAACISCAYADHPSGYWWSLLLYLKELEEDLECYKGVVQNFFRHSWAHEQISGTRSFGLLVDLVLRRWVTKPVYLLQPEHRLRRFMLSCILELELQFPRPTVEDLLWLF